LLGLFFDPEDGGDMLLWNVSWLSMDYTVLYLRRQEYPVLQQPIFHRPQLYLQLAVKGLQKYKNSLSVFVVDVH
jgi:hypothetical protein